MKTKYENLIAELDLNLNEIRSCIIILQQAIQNEFSDVELCDIDNHLEILVEKMDKTIENANELDSINISEIKKCS